MRSLRTAIAVCKLSCIFHFLSFFAFFLVLPVSFRYFVPFFALFCSVVFFLVFWPFAFCGKLRPWSSLKAENCSVVFFFGFLAFCLLWKVTTNILSWSSLKAEIGSFLFWFFGLLPFVESYNHVLLWSSLKAENW